MSMEMFGFEGPFDSEDNFNLVVATKQDRVLIGRKNRGHLIGRLVLPGGKIHEFSRGINTAYYPAVADAARELREETGIYALESAMLHVGRLAITNYEPDGQVEDKLIDIFKVEVSDSTEPEDTEELSEIHWIEQDNLPFEEMPGDYEIWLPGVLAGYAIHGFIEAEGLKVLSATGAKQKIPSGRLETLAVSRQ